MDFKELSLCSGIIFALFLICQMSFINAQLDLPSMPGPPYPDPRGQNRWGVKFDPRVHGPPFDKTQEDGGKPNNNFQRPRPPPPSQLNSYQRPSVQQDSYQRPPSPPPQSHQSSQSQEIAFQRPPPPPPFTGGSNNYKSIQASAPAGFNQNPNGNYNFKPYQQYNNQPQLTNSNQFANVWNSQYNNNNNKGSSQSIWNNINSNNNNQYSNNNNNYNYNKAVRPSSALSSYDLKTKEEKYKDDNYWNRIMGFFSSNNVNKNRNMEAQVQPSNFRYNIDFDYPRRQNWRNNKAKGRPSRPHPPPRNKWKSKKKQQKSWPIFTTIGKGMDAVNGGVNNVRKVVQGTTGRALATGVKIGGKVAYLGAQTAAKVITKVSSW